MADGGDDGKYDGIDVGNELGRSLGTSVGVCVLGAALGEDVTAIDTGAAVDGSPCCTFNGTRGFVTKLRLLDIRSLINTSSCQGLIQF